MERAQFRSLGVVVSTVVLIGALIVTGAGPASAVVNTMTVTPNTPVRDYTLVNYSGTITDSATRLATGQCRNEVVTNPTDVAVNCNLKLEHGSSAGNKAISVDIELQQVIVSLARLSDLNTYPEIDCGATGDECVVATYSYQLSSGQRTNFQLKGYAAIDFDTSPWNHRSGEITPYAFSTHPTTGQTAEDPVGTQFFSPAQIGQTASIDEGPITGSSNVAGLSYFGQEVQVVAPDPEPPALANVLMHMRPSDVPAGQVVRAFHNDTLLPICPGGDYFYPCTSVGADARNVYVQIRTASPTGTYNLALGAPNSVTITPDTGIGNGEVVTASGHITDPFSQAYAVVCTGFELDIVTPSYIDEKCDMAAATDLGSSPGNRDFSVPVTVHDEFAVHDGTITDRVHCGSYPSSCSVMIISPVSAERVRWFALAPLEVTNPEPDPYLDPLASATVRAGALVPRTGYTGHPFNRMVVALCQFDGRQGAVTENEINSYCDMENAVTYSKSLGTFTLNTTHRLVPSFDGHDFENQPIPRTCGPATDLVTACRLHVLYQRIYGDGPHYRVLGNPQAVTFDTSPITSASATAPPDGSVSTHPYEGTQTAADPLGATVTTPTGGSVSITEQNPTAAPPSGYSFVGQQVSITAPPASSSTDPLKIDFFLDSSLLPSGVTVNDLEVFRNGVLIQDCTGDGSVASPDPCIYSRALNGSEIQLRISSTAASRWNVGVSSALGPETVTINPIPTKTYGGFAFNATATSSKGSPITFSRASYTILVAGGSIPCTVSSAGRITLTGAGTCTVRATGSSDTDTTTFTINRRPQVITFAELAPRTYGTAPAPVSATSNSGLAVTFTNTGTACTVTSAGTVTLVAAGTCQITARRAGNDKYLPATAVTRTLTVNKATKNPTFPAIGAQYVGAGPITVTVTGNGSTSPVALTSTTTTICSIVNGNQVRLLKVGTCTLRATQAADANYNAGAANKSFNIRYNVTQTVTMSGTGTTRQADVRVSIFNFNKTVNMGASTIAVTATKMDGGALPSQLASPNNKFVFNSTSKQYRLVFRTTGLAAGTHRLTYTVAGDPVVKTIAFTV